MAKTRRMLDWDWAWDWDRFAGFVLVSVSVSLRLVWYGTVSEMMAGRDTVRRKSVDSRKSDQGALGVVLGLGLGLGLAAVGWG